jgi:hypothetical protein
MVDGGLPPLHSFFDGIRYQLNGGGYKPGRQQAADQNALCTKVNVKRCQQQVLFMVVVVSSGSSSSSRLYYGVWIEYA